MLKPMPLTLEDDHMCYVCGKKNSSGFQLEFFHPKPGQLLAEVVFRKEHQGFKDIVHGGMIAMLLDEMMVNLAWKEGLSAVTAELTIRLKKAVQVGQKVLLEGLLEDSNPKKRLISMSASAKNPAGETYATASAKCLRINPSA